VSVLSCSLVSSHIRRIVYGNNKFVAVGVTSDYSAKMATSSDGVTWTTVEDNKFNGGNSINAIAYGNNTFVAVGSRGKMAYCTDN